MGLWVLLATFQIKLNAPIRHFTCFIAPFSHHCICNGPFWIWRTDRPPVILFGHLRRTDPAYLVELPRVKKSVVIPDIRYALVV